MENSQPERYHAAESLQDLPQTDALVDYQHERYQAPGSLPKPDAMVDSQLERYHAAGLSQDLPQPDATMELLFAVRLDSQGDARPMDSQSVQNELAARLAKD